MYRFYYQKWRTEKGSPLKVKLLKFEGYLPNFKIDNIKYEGEEWLVELPDGTKTLARFRSQILNPTVFHSHIDENQNPSQLSDGLNILIDSYEEVIENKKKEEPDFLMKHEIKKDIALKNALNQIIKESNKDSLIKLYCICYLDFLDSPCTETLKAFKNIKARLNKEPSKIINNYIKRKTDDLLCGK